jgi:hypothetical protein
MTAMEQLKKKHESEIARLTLEMELVGNLPTLPIVSNHNSRFLADKDVVAWFSFSSTLHKQDGEYNPVKLLEQLEAEGWEIIPASLVKWDDYRAAFEPGLVGDIKLRGTYKKITSKEPILPYWFEPNQYGDGDFCVYMKRGDKTVRVSVDVTTGPSLYARRIESMGEWRFESGTCKVRIPASWQYVNDIEIHTKGYVDTSKGISGRVWFTSLYRQEEWKMKASEFLNMLLTSKVK